jgi:hypothetical protein
MFDHELVENGAVRNQGDEGPLLVHSHHAAVTSNVGGEDDGEFAIQRPAAPAVGNVNRFRLRQPRREEKPKDWIDG